MGANEPRQAVEIAYILYAVFTEESINHSSQPQLRPHFVLQISTIQWGGQLAAARKC